MDWTYRLRLRNLQMLLSLEQTRNMSRTAAEFNTAQPALSRWLKELEDDVGLPLFDRHARGLRPTRYGVALIAHARRIESHLDAARDDVAAMRDGGSGRIIVGTSGASTGSTAPLAVLRLMELFPEASIELVENPMDRLVDQLAAGEIDVIIGRPLPQGTPAGILSETLYDDPIDFIARCRHPLVDRTDIDWDELFQYRWIVWPRGLPARNALDQALAAVGRQVPPRSIQSGTVTLNLTLVSNTDMICLASRRDAHRFASWDIVRTVSMPVTIVGKVAMHWRDDGDRRPLLLSMLNCLRDVVSSAGS